MHRRRYLEGAGLALVAALAGCTDAIDTAGDDPASDDGSAGDDASSREDADTDDGPPEDDAADEEIDRGELESMTRTAVEEEVGNGDETEAEGVEADDTGGTGTDDPGMQGTVYAQVDYDGDWTLAYSTRRRTSSFDRSGLQTVEIDDDLDVISVAVQKRHDDDDELTVLVLLDGSIVAEGSTTDPFGIAQATHSAL
ncbi:hypothetical protein [Halalkalicoccus sp. NIPERK01]|uniref:hypothetical protein n=1 Tax=Halalkalicoccus sp. NIPERK01 TaxID=3053469 RepID=UPI00256EEC61|nr:hypothetical protein [Halalkalicoccus sp. NIPERK01]MDL5363313.1 hypothetical protein [Halalkalicoccus sp. NIPERK01]